MSTLVSGIKQTSILTATNLFLNEFKFKWSIITFLGFYNYVFLVCRSFALNLSFFALLPEYPFFEN